MLRALLGTVIVARAELEKAPSGLWYGREVTLPWGTVIASGDPSIAIGQRVIFQADESAQVYEDMKVQTLFTSRPHDGKTRPGSEVLAIYRAGQFEDTGDRVVLKLQPSPPASEVIEGVTDRDGVERGEDIHGRAYLYPRASGSQWSDSTGRYASVRRSELAAEACA